LDQWRTILVLQAEIIDLKPQHEWVEADIADGGFAFQLLATELRDIPADNERDDGDPITE
jgi:hypothetical protein